LRAGYQRRRRNSQSTPATSTTPAVAMAAADPAAESVIRTLSEFSQAGLVEPTPRHVRVLEPEKLPRAHW